MIGSHATASPLSPISAAQRDGRYKTSRIGRKESWYNMAPVPRAMLPVPKVCEETYRQPSHIYHYTNMYEFLTSNNKECICSWMRCLDFDQAVMITSAVEQKWLDSVFFGEYSTFYDKQERFSETPRCAYLIFIVVIVIVIITIFVIFYVPLQDKGISDISNYSCLASKWTRAIAADFVISSVPHLTIFSFIWHLFNYTQVLSFFALSYHPNSTCSI